MKKVYNSVTSGAKYSKHNMTGTVEFDAWNRMKVRCYKKNSKDYCNYGGRGIKICDEWLSNPIQFYKDMGKRPSSNHSIDRIDNDGDYTPENCRWATKKEQIINRRIFKNNKSGYKGIFKAENKWRVFCGRKYLGTFNNLQDAIKTRKKAELKYWGQYGI